MIIITLARYLNHHFSYWERETFQQLQGHKFLLEHASAGRKKSVIGLFQQVVPVK